MSWKGASQPRTLERAFQAVEIAQEDEKEGAWCAEEQREAGVAAAL